MNGPKARTCALAFIVIGGLLPTHGWCQKITSFERNYVQSALQQIAPDVKKHYYDPKFHGVDWDSKVRETKQRIDQADTWDGAISEVAALLDSLKDSHTFLVPPQRTFRHDYGWTSQMIGGRCYVIHVRAGSDAESKGVKPGDELLAVDGYTPTRNNFRKLEYVFNVLRPQPELHLDLRDPAGKRRTVDVQTKVIQTVMKHGDLAGTDRHDASLDVERKIHELRPRVVEMGDELMILKLPVFFLPELEADSLLGKARRHKALILDLREDPGGRQDTLNYLLGAMFNREVKVGDRVSRDERRPVVTKTHGNSFDGKLVVLVDSTSASASELFARVVQIERRGVILGDLSAGAVMESKLYDYQNGVGRMVSFRAEITSADVVMTDGKSLEQVGVTPDETVLPTADDLAEHRDPVLARAAEMLGVNLNSDDAGKMFPYEWPPQ